MDLHDFSGPQRQALLDLAILAMYADGNLTAVEDARVQRLLTGMGYDTDYDRGRQYDAAVTRVSRHSQTAEAARAYAATLAQGFTTREQRSQAYDLIQELVTSDSHITLQEGSYLTLVTEAFQANP